MATGKFSDQLNALAYASIDQAADLDTVWDDSAGELKYIATGERIKRSLGSSDIAWMTALANLAAVAAADDKFILWDASASAFKTLTASEVLAKTFAATSISSITALTNLAAVTPADDKLIVWDASATAWKVLGLGELVPVLQAGAYFYNIVTYGADPTGVADSTSAINAAHTAAAASTPKGIVIAPIGAYKCATTATLLASMIGMGGAGYDSTMARAVFVPTMTDGTACLSAKAKAGIHLARFTIGTGLGTASARNCIGLQWGQCAALMVAATKANPCVITTKYPHTMQTGDSVTISNVAGMTNLNGNTYTVTRVSDLSFSIGVNSSAYGTYTSGGLVIPTDLGVANAVSRSTAEDITVDGMAVGFHLEGWINRLSGLKAFNCALGLDASYQNGSLLDYVSENCGQSYQLLGCNGLHISRIMDEGGTASSLVKASTIDYCNSVTCDMVYTEGTRATDTPWLEVGGVSFCEDIHYLHGFFGATPGVAKSVTFNSCRRYSLPPPGQVASGYSTTSNTTSGTSFTPTWSSTGSAPAIGNGSLTGSYQWHGSAVTVSIVFAPGSTTTFGTGTYSFGLPFTAKFAAIGAAKLLDAGTQHYVGAAEITAGQSSVKIFAQNTSGVGSEVAETFPFTWANTDTLQLTITIPV